MLERRSWLVPLAIATGLACLAGVLLVATQADSDPVGARYDTFNRVLTLGLALMLTSGLAVRARVPRGAPGARALTVVAVAVAVVLAGNVVEFSGALAVGEETEKTAARLGLEESFWGSLVGWLLFLGGSIVRDVALVAVAVRLGRWGGVSRAQRVAVGASGFAFSAATALWAVSPAAVIVPAVIFAFGWLALANVAEARAAQAPAVAVAAQG